VRRKEHRDGQKHCHKCDTWRGLDQFHARTKNWDGLHGQCKPCMSASAALRYVGDRERLLTLGREYRRLNNQKRRDAQVQSDFGLSPEAYKSLREKHGNTCSLCGEEYTKKRLHVDHDHVTGVVRGLLCFRCNIGLGYLRDSPELLRAAADYVERHKAGMA
jgi:hypothetical protein